MKPKFPKVAPEIEIFPGVRATLISDFEQYSNGSFFMGLTECKIGEAGKELGTMSTDVAGRWYVTVGTATYRVPMQDLFAAFLEAHTRPVAA